MASHIVCRRQVARTVAVLVTALFALLAVQGVARADTTSGAIAIMLPSNAAPPPNQSAELFAIACPVAGECVAVGEYRSTSASVPQPMAVREVGGVWQQAQSVTPPAPSGSDAYGAQLTGVGCTAPGTCVAVGGYTDSSSHLYPMQEAMTGGAWAGQAASVSTVGGSTESSLSEVDCPSAGSGSCVADGYYVDSTGAYNMAIASGSPGGLSGLQTIAAPADSQPPDPTNGYYGPLLTGVGCSPDGPCTTLGTYLSTSDAYENLYVSGTSGPAEDLGASPASGATGVGEFLGVSCAGTDDCVAVGATSSGSGTVPMADIQSPNGSWGPEQLVSGAGGKLISVACPDFYSCIAAGDVGAGSPYTTSLDADGSWSSPSPVGAPSGGTSPYLTSVACPPKDTTDCWAAGQYTATASDTPEAYVVSETTPDNSSGSSSPCQAVSATTPENTPVTITLTCPAGTGSGLTYSITGGPADGTLGSINQSNATVVYTPSTGYTGSDGFGFKVTGPNGLSQSGTVAITVTPASTGGSGSGGSGSGGSGGSGSGGSGSGGSGSGGSGGSDGSGSTGTAGLGAVKHLPAAIALAVTCSGAATQRCSVKATLTAIELLRGGKLISASVGRARSRRRTVTLGTVTATLHGGQHAVLVLHLNANGRRLLRRLHRLRVTLALSQSTGNQIRAVSRRGLTLRAARGHRSKR